MTAGPIHRGFLSSVEDLIAEARNGRVVILVDDEDRENEGDFVIPAQMATPDAINFMATHGRGLVCLALTSRRVSELGLTPMVRENGTKMGTAFTASIEAIDGITTGISAADRARTVATAINGAKGPNDIVSPGHVFPLIARDGGVLMRTGHTEAAVDLARLAGLNPSGVICEVMKDDGTMARLDDLMAFGQRHNVKIGTIRDMIAFRRRHDHLVKRTGETTIHSQWGGDWRAISYRNIVTGDESLALLKGEIDDANPILVRMHAMDIIADALGANGPKRGQLSAAMRTIEAAGRGVVVLINRSGRHPIADAVAARASNLPTQETDAVRDYGGGAQILADLGIHEMVLLTNSRHTMVALAGYGLDIVAQQAIELRE